VSFNFFAPSRHRHLALLVPATAVLALGLAACQSPAPDAASSPSASTGASAAASAPATATAGAGTEVTPAAPQGTPEKQAAPAKVKDDSGIEGVLAWDTAGYPAAGTPGAGTVTHNHVTTPVTYAVTPAIGGNHAPVWMNAGVYTKPVPSERAVHDLEHGAVWITYSPGLPAAQVKQLQDFVGRQSEIPEQEQDLTSGATVKNANRYMVMSPWKDGSLPSKIVISAWGHQLRVDSADDSRLQDFVDTFRHSQKYTPEFGAQVDGVPTGTGGNPAADGSSLPNPEGTLPANAGM